ncbi:hypothetical protein BDN67DRAFT_1013925 [Paxillus ammoniavirescens]|nr:hypothetical protein BDN67DRAFT_1013925 [Paxillus ammoniavirescens]
MFVVGRITQPVALIGKPRASSLLSWRAGCPSIKPPTERPKVAASHPEMMEMVNTVTDTVTKIEASLVEITGTSCREFVESLCKEYIRSGDHSNIYRAVSSMEELDQRVQAIRKVLAYRCDDHTAGIQDRIRSVNRVLEDILLHAMEGNNIADLWGWGLLLYQSIGIA